MPIISSLKALLTAETDDFREDIKQAGDEAEKFNKKTKNAGEGPSKMGASVDDLMGAVDTLVASGLVLKAGEMLLDFGRDSVAAADEAARAQAQLEAVIKSTGGAAGLTADELGDMANELMGITGVEDDLILKNEALLLTFTNIGRNIFPDAMQAALDMSAVLGQDLQSSVVQLGKALNDPIEGVTALKRVGVNFNEEQREMIKNMVEAGKTAEAQRFILEELQTEFGGAAEAMHEAGSRSEDLANSFGNFQEALGANLLPTVREANKELSGFFDNLANRITINTQMKESLDAGIISLDEYQQHMIITNGALNASADAEQWLSEKLAGHTARMNTLQMAGRGYSDQLEEQSEVTVEAADDVSEFSDKLAQAENRMRGVASASKAAEEPVESFLEGINRQIDSPIKSFIEDLEWMQATGGRFEEAFAQVQGALDRHEITPEQADQFTKAIYTSVIDVQEELGNIDGDQAAQNIADTLGISLEDALALINGTDGLMEVMDDFSNTEYSIDEQLRMSVEGVGDEIKGDEDSLYAKMQSFTQKEWSTNVRIGVSGPGAAYISGGGGSAAGTGGEEPGWARGVTDFIVPPGFPNDSFLVGLTSGEVVNVAPAGMGGGDQSGGAGMVYTDNSRTIITGRGAAAQFYAQKRAAAWRRGNHFMG